MVVLHGIEVSCSYNGKEKTKGGYAHFCCFGTFNDNHTTYYYKNYLQLQKDISNLIKNYSLVQFNHPLFSRLLDSEFIKLNGFHLIEVYNHKDYYEETGIQNAELLIRTLLNHNKKLLVTAGDDFHGPYKNCKTDKCFGGFLMVNANKNEQDIINSIKNGEFYASCGPEIFDYRICGRKIKIKTSKVKNIIFLTNKRKCKNIFDDNDKEINYGEYVLSGEEFYVWCKVVDKNGKMAWTQPIYIDNNNYFKS